MYFSSTIQAEGMKWITSHKFQNIFIQIVRSFNKTQNDRNGPLTTTMFVGMCTMMGRLGAQFRRAELINRSE